MREMRKNSQGYKAGVRQITAHVYSNRFGRRKIVNFTCINTMKYATYYFVDVVKVSGNTIKTKVTAQFYITGMILVTNLLTKNITNAIKDIVVKRL